MKEGSFKLNKSWFWGGSLCLLGILLVRVQDFFPLPGQRGILLTLLGILLAASGLLVIASGLERVNRKVKWCPQCHTLNPYEVEHCKNCQTAL